MRFAQIALALTACETAAPSTDPPDPFTPIPPEAPVAEIAAETPCQQLVNMAADAGVSALGRIRDDGTAIVLATGGPAGGMVPMQLGLLGLKPLLNGPGSCAGLSVAATAAVVVGSCTHDVDGRNRYGTPELVLLRPGGAHGSLTERADPFSLMGPVAVTADGHRILYHDAGMLRVIDLDTGTSGVLSPMPVGASGRLSSSDDGSVVLVPAPAERMLWLYDAVRGAWSGLAIGQWGVVPDGDLDAAGHRIVFVSATDPTGANPTLAPQVFLWDRSAGFTSQLTDFPPGSQRAASPRLDAAGRRLVFLASAPIDGGPLWPTPRVMIIDLDERGIPSAAREVPVGAAATDLMLARSGTFADVRGYTPPSLHAGVLRVFLDGQGPPPQELVRGGGWGEIVDLSGNGRFAAMTQSAAGASHPRMVAVPGTQALELPWVGSLDYTGRRAVALIPDGTGRRVLAVWDVAAAVERRINSAIALGNEPRAGPGGVSLSADGRRAAFLSSISGVRSLYLADVDTEQVTLVDTGLTQPALTLALDHAGERLLYWRPDPSPEAGGRLYMWSPQGPKLLFETRWPQAPRGPVALADRRVAFCSGWSNDAICRLAILDLDEASGPLGPPRSFLGVDVKTSLTLSPDGTHVTFVGAAPGVRGLLRLDLVTGSVRRLAPPAMLRAIIRGNTCAWNALDGGAVVALP